MTDDEKPLRPPPTSSFEDLLLELLRSIDRIAREVESRWLRGESPRLEDRIGDVPSEGRDALFSELLYLELVARRRRGESLSIEELRRRFPNDQLLINDCFEESLRDSKMPLDLQQGDSAEPAESALGDRISIRLPQIPGYQLIRPLGRGAMGVVFLAQHQRLERLVALKMVGITADPRQARARIRAEANAIARLQHPNIVQIFEVGEHEGETFLALEFVNGRSLRELLAGGRLAHREAALLVEVLARAMNYAHANGIVHRDLKPGNVLLQERAATIGQSDEIRSAAHASSDQRGHEPQIAEFRVSDVTPKISDFGLAKILGVDHAQTQTGSMLGTPNYMSPEQAAGRSDEVGPAADVYALGAMLFELLCGRPPFEAESTLELLRQIASVEPVFPADAKRLVPRDLQAVCLKCLEKEPGARYASAVELADDLRRHLDDYPVRARASTRFDQFRKFARRNKVLVGSMAAIWIALLAGSLGTAIFAVREARQRTQAEINAEAARASERIAQTEAYRARISLAVSALESDNVTDASRQLDLAPARHRDWEWFHLRNRLDESFFVRYEPGDSNGSFFYGPWGARFTNGSSAGMCISDHAGRELLMLPKHRWPWIEHLGQSSLGFWIVEGTTPLRLHLLESTGEPRATVEIPVELSSAVMWAVSRDSSRVALGGSHTEDLRKLFYVLDIPTGQRRGPYAGHEDRITSLDFSPDGTKIVSTSDDNTLRLWSVLEEQPAIVMRGHQRKVLGATFRADGTQLLSHSADGTVRQWDAFTGHEIGPPFEEHRGEVLAAYSPDGEWIASGGTDRTIRVWRSRERKAVKVLRGHTGDVLGLAFERDGQQLVSLGSDRAIRTWNVQGTENATVLRGHASYVYPLAFSPDGSWIASGSWDHTVRLWDVATGDCRAVLQHPNIVRTLSISPDGSWLVSGCDSEKQLYVWDVATTQIRKRIPGSDQTLRAVEISPDGRSIAALDLFGNLRIVDASTKNLQSSARFAKQDLRGAMAYSPDGLYLASTCDGFHVGLWDVRQRSLVQQCCGHTDQVYSVAFSSDGKRAVTGSLDQTARVWDVDTGVCLSVLRGHSGAIFSAVFHPNGKRIASGGRDRLVWIWDADVGMEIARLQGHTNYVFSLAFSPDGSSLASASGDGTVRLWKTDYRKN